MDPGKTDDWIDLYSLVLDRLAEFLADPKKMAKRLGITDKELKAQEHHARLPGKMDMEKYHELRISWKSVAAALRSFGVQLGEDIQLSPLMHEMAKPEWNAAPWLQVFHAGEKPLMFYGRDAITALGFFNFFIQQCEQLDPRLRIRQELEAQGITKENFRERLFGTSVRNPWEDTPSP